VSTLVRFSQRRLTELFGARAARLYGIGIAASFGVMIAVLPRPVSIGALEGLLLQALRSASWFVAGLCAFSAARDLARRDFEEGVTALVAQRGHDARSLELSRGLAAAQFIALWIGVPSSILALIAWIKTADPARWAWTAGWLGFVIVYSSLLGIVVAGLARAASRLSPHRGRSLLAAFVFVPELLRTAWPSVPSVPAVFAWALDRAAELDSLTLGWSARG